MRNKIVFAFFIIIIALGMKSYLAPTEDIDFRKERSEITPTKPSQEAFKVRTSKDKKVKKNLLSRVKPKLSGVKLKKLGDDYAPIDEEGNRYITQVLKDEDGHIIYHGDIYLGDEEEVRLRLKKGLKVRPPKLWENGEVFYEISSEVKEDIELLSEINKSISYLNEKTNVAFKERFDQDNYVVFTTTTSNCYSQVGQQGGKQKILLSTKCRQREVLHEMMHTLGFFHEQNREDRDEYIEVLWQNIREEHHAQFKKLTNDYIDVLDRPFDFKSIMLYPPNAFSDHPDQPSILRADGGDDFHTTYSLMSAEDIYRVNKTYPKN